jgi:hypothetical protein
VNIQILHSVRPTSRASSTKDSGMTVQEEAPNFSLESLIGLIIFSDSGPFS